MGKLLPMPEGDTLVLDYVPRPQFVPYHQRRQRNAVIICHRRCGKTIATIADLVMRAIAHSPKKEPGRFAFVSPTYTQSKDIGWQYLKNFARPFLAEQPNESELRVDLLNHARIRLYGGDNPDSLRGLGFDAIVVDEFADVSPSLYPAVLRPALADRKGKCTFIGTVKGRNHLWKTFEEHRSDPDWYAALLPASKTGLLSAEELAAARKDMGDAQYGAEFECDPSSPIIGAYFGQQMKDADVEGRLEPNLAVIDGPIHTAWDLGHGSNMAIWAFQVGDDGLRIIDFISETGLFFNDYLAELNRRGYNGNDYVPHDINAPSFETGLTRIETLAKAGRKPMPVPLGKIEDRIHAAQLILPRCRFDSTKCELGLAALREYRRDWDDKLKVFKDTPKHDWASHGADAFTYLAMGWTKKVVREPDPPKPLFRPRTYADLDDDFEITFEGVKIIREERKPRRHDRA
jgi:phage terminase large subunit